MLSVKYGADVPPALVEVLEYHARQTGLPLDALELIGSSLDFVEHFIVAAEEGHANDFARDLLGVPTDRIALARWQAGRLFGGDEAEA